MSEEKQIQEYKSKQLIDELSKMPSMVIATAYLHAINYTLYGEDVTEKWVTATQNAMTLEKAYNKGYHDALQRLAESEEQEPNTGHWIPVSERLPEDGQNVLFCDIDNDIMVGYHVKDRPKTHFSQDGTYEDMKNVRAWMPLPKPYETNDSKAKEI